MVAVGVLRVCRGLRMVVFVLPVTFCYTLQLVGEPDLEVCFALRVRAAASFSLCWSFFAGTRVGASGLCLCLSLPPW